MNSILATSFPQLRTPSSFLHLPILKPQQNGSTPRSPAVMVRASSSDVTHRHRPVLVNLKSLTKTVIVVGVTVSMACKLSLLPAKAETPATVVEQTPAFQEEEEVEAEREGGDQNVDQTEDTSPLSDLLDSSPEAIESLKSLLQEKLDGGEDEAAVRILKRLVSVQPSVTEWKFLLARLLNEMGQTQDSRLVFEDILAANPLSFEALFENALLMDRCGEGEAVIRRLQEALDVAEEEHKAREARDVRLIMAQMQFLQKNVEEALKSYQELSKEDPNDFRPYFCRGMIYSLLDRNEEAKEQFAKYRELSPKKFEVEGYLRTPLSRMKMFGSNEN